VLDLIILSLGLMLHMWALPYSFKNLLFDSIVRCIQLAFGIAVLFRLQPAALQPTGIGLIAGFGVGAACFMFQVLWNRGVRLRRPTLTRRFLASQAVILLFQAPAEEIFYRGVFFAVVCAIWGPLTAVVISASLTTMLAIVSSRRRVLWLGAGLLGLLCCLGYYWSQCIWAPVLIHVLNDLGFVTLSEQRNLFEA
jgi:membrane protease YdiL (CAAX protease family)